MSDKEKSSGIENVPVVLEFPDSKTKSVIPSDFPGKTVNNLEVTCPVTFRLIIRNPLNWEVN